MLLSLKGSNFWACHQTWEWYCLNQDVTKHCFYNNMSWIFRSCNYQRGDAGLWTTAEGLQGKTGCRSDNQSQNWQSALRCWKLCSEVSHAWNWQLVMEKYSIMKRKEAKGSITAVLTVSCKKSIVDKWKEVQIHMCTSMWNSLLYFSQIYNDELLNMFCSRVFCYLLCHYMYENHVTTQKVSLQTCGLNCFLTKSCFYEMLMKIF